MRRKVISKNQPRKPKLVDAQKAIDLTLTPIAIGQILASVESLRIGKLYRPNGLLRGVSARGTKPGTTKHTVMTALDSSNTPLVLAAINLLSSIALLVFRGKRVPQIIASSFIGISNRLNEIRTPYGRDGADQMTALITQYRVLSALIPDRVRSDDFFLRAVNLQAGLSYFVSGVSKFFGSSWVQGDALGEVLQTQAYGGGPAAKILKGRTRLNRLLTWITPIWETGFPLIYLLPSQWGSFGLAAAKGFHLAVAAVMELPRFFWGFSGAHGAVKYVINQTSAHQRKLSRLEKTVLASATGVTLVSGAYAAAQRQLDKERRRGLKGTRLLEMPDGVVEYKWSSPTDFDVDPSTAPILVLEAGLGNPLDAWAWVFEKVSAKNHVLAYHRGGYGLTTSKVPSAVMINHMVDATRSSGKLIVVTHSLGLLKLAEYAREEISGRKISTAILVDGTDPELLSADRSNRRRAGAFLQSQLHSMFAAFTGVYNFAPNAVARQSAYAPDDQNGSIQFIYSPKNIYRATHEYFEIATSGAMESLRSIGNLYVLASQENAAQQSGLAEKLNADYRLIPGASHRSILGFSKYAEQVGNAIQEAVDASK